MSIASILGPDGAIARRLPHYEARPQQLAMAEAVADAIAGGRKLMVEAGTGVGKSFAYLVPAMLAATAQQGLPRRHFDAHHQSAGAIDPQRHPVSPKRHAAGVHGRAGQGPVQLPQPAPAARGPAADRRPDGRAGRRRAAATDRQWSRRTEDGSRSDLGFPAAAGRLGRRRERQRQLPGPGLPRLRQMLLLQGPQADVRRPAAGRQPRPVLQRPRPAPAGRQPAAGLPGRDLRRGPHAGRRGRRPPRPQGRPRRRRTSAQQALQPPPAARPARAGSATKTPCDRSKSRATRRTSSSTASSTGSSASRDRSGRNAARHGVRLGARPRAGHRARRPFRGAEKAGLARQRPRREPGRRAEDRVHVPDRPRPPAGARREAMAGPGAAGAGLLDRRGRRDGTRAWNWSALQSRSARPWKSSSTARSRPW